jgi:SNF2 family DNA or RNA helicase
MEIVDNKALLLSLRNPKRVTEVIPKSREVGDGKVLVRWGLEEAQVLKNLKIRNVPSPILAHYDWAGQHKPFEHQKTTASFLTLHRKAFCFNEQGTGKTGSVIWAADYLMKQGSIKRVLVICPLSIMDSAWRADLFKFAMHRTVDIAYGAADKRRQIINGNAEFVVINYDGVEIVRDEIANGGFDLIVIDEANAYKNAQSKRWKILNGLITAKTWLWMLTGTPAAQSPLDAYGLAKLVNPSAVPKFFTAFKDMVMYKVSNFRWIPKDSATNIVFTALQPAIRFTKDECLDLPEMTYVKREVALTKQQEKYYKLLKTRMVMEAAGEEITSVNAAVNMNKLLQISCGAVYSDSGETIEFDIKNRYRALVEVIEEASQKVLVFVPFKHVIAILKNKLTADGIPTEVISGDVPVRRRTSIFDDFQRKQDPRVLIIQPQAAAHGVTLTAANTVVWWGPVPSLETYAQANARVHRSGQRHPSTVVQLQGSSVERHVYSLLDNKIDVHSKVVDLYKNLLV